MKIRMQKNTSAQSPPATDLSSHFVYYTRIRISSINYYEEESSPASLPEEDYPYLRASQGT